MPSSVSKPKGRFALFNLSEKQLKSLSGKQAEFAPHRGAERVAAAREAAQEIIGGFGGSLLKLKARVSEKWKVRGMVKNSEILAQIPPSKRNGKILGMLKVRLTRTLSGVSPVAVMTTSKCPHGRCTYCPSGEGTANSYTGFEPAAMRGRKNGYDSYLQVESRLAQYYALGHVSDKCELIVMGGTFNAQPLSYQHNFIKRAFDAFNGTVSGSMQEAIMANQKAKHRVIGVTYETKPDWAMEQADIDNLLAMAATRVELGVQVLSDRIYKKVNRGHTVADVARATRNLRDNSIKVGYHMMPGLYQTPSQDIATFKKLFSDERFKPDMLKIYPVLVLKGTKLYDEFKAGKFKPYDTETTAEVVAKIQRTLPPYVRVMRIQRDIPSNLIEGGAKNSNIRQIAENIMKERGWVCRCIRCREVGVAAHTKGKNPSMSALELTRLDYAAGRGKEIFLSFEDAKSDTLAGFIRLRIPSQTLRSEITQSTALIRELHVYGQEVAVGAAAGTGSAQHLGLGNRLLAEAERIASDEFGRDKMVIISGIGAREYYFKRGYRADGPYVSKRI